MSDFAVTIEQIGEIRPHTNADRLEIAKLASMDFQFVVQKGVYKTGDKVVYFPVDSLLPDKLAKDLGLEGKLGRNNRIKTIKLRGESSQGVVADMKFLHSYFGDRGFLPGASTSDLNMVDPRLDFTQLFGVTKYEVPEFIKVGQAGSAGWLPDGQHVYDIESVQRYPEETKLLLSKVCVITEKLEGSHFSYVRDAKGDHVCSRRMELRLGDDNTYAKMVEKYQLDLVMDNLWNELESEFTFESVALHAEMIGPGIQGNIYGLTQHELRFFDIILGGNRGLDWWDLNYYTRNHWLSKICNRVNWLPLVPEIEYEYSTNPNPDLVAFSNGKSLLKPDVLREGIVIRRLTEEENLPSGKRLLLKVRSPEYLAGSEL